MAQYLSIGRFARRAGLSVGALRHYDELGLLPPARVDPATGYRYYAPEQVRPARLIAVLRGLDLPLAEIGPLLTASQEEIRARLVEHRTAVDARLWRLQRLAHRLRRLDKEDLMGPSEFTLDPDDERRLAARLFNRVWELLEQEKRSREDDDEMLHAAHASRYHWGRVGQPVNLSRGEWQCSRVYAVLGRAEPALHHARRCLDLCEEHGMGEFDHGAAHEALARAYQVAGDDPLAGEHLAAGRGHAGQVTDDEDRQVLLDDLAQLDPG